MTVTPHILPPLPSPQLLISVLECQCVLQTVDGVRDPCPIHLTSTPFCICVSECACVLQAMGDVRDPNPIHPHLPRGPFAPPAGLPAAAALWLT